MAGTVFRHLGRRVGGKIFRRTPRRRSNSGRNFGNVPFEWCYALPQYERATAMELTALVQSHERLNGPIPADQHAHLITLIEKRLNADSQIRADYLLKRGPKPIAGETWQ
jgi:hypothetical protein